MLAVWVVLRSHCMQGDWVGMALGDAIDLCLAWAGLEAVVWAKSAVMPKCVRCWKAH